MLNCPRLAQILNRDVVHVIEDLVFSNHPPDEGIGFRPHAGVNTTSWVKSTASLVHA